LKLKRVFRRFVRFAYHDDPVAFYFDASYYKKHLDSRGIVSDGDLFHHYKTLGWKVGFDPSPNFCVERYWNANPDVFASGVEPLHHWINYGIQEGRAFTDGPWDNPENMKLLREQFNETFYMNYNHPNLTSPQEALDHFTRVGWRLEFDPNPNFNTQLYKEMENINSNFEYPHYLHYLLNNKNSDRALTYPRFRNEWNLNGVGTSTPRMLPNPRFISLPVEEQETKELEYFIGKLIEKNYNFTRKTIISWGNNDYLETIGGIEIILKIELDQCVQQGYNHVYIYRDVQDRPTYDDESKYYTLIINGTLKMQLMRKKLVSLVDYLAAKTTIKTFNLHGKIFSYINDIAQIAGIAAQKNFFVHDYSLVCNSYTLLRNEIESCFGPAPTSKLCQTCISGTGRAKLISENSQFLDENGFVAISPSEVAKSIFIKTFPNVEVRTRPHLQFVDPDPISPRRPKINKKYRIAFTGHPAAHKGWNAYTEFFRHGSSRNDFDFFQLGSIQGDPRINFVNVVPVHGRSTMRDALIKNEIDVVFQWSIAAETFGIVTAEAISAGCLVISNPLSGNVSEMAESQNRLLSYDDLDELIASHNSGQLEASITERMLKVPRSYYSLEWNSFIDLPEFR